MSKRIAALGITLALCVAASYVEFLLPPVLPNLPGVKLGLANCVVLVLLYRYGTGFALSVNVVRCVIAGVLFSGIWGLIYSLGGALVSFTAMAALRKTKRFSVLGISICGGATHNMAQLAIAALVLNNAATFSVLYAPLLLAGLCAGVLTGLAAKLLLERLPW
ncbi:MAG: Gx transporter family protein [Oscillospiraceae bacterium]|jgi:heptaprenyl diphosphate synthase|nr:Gx transporter family protein [Oscillospiraceae bacterium]